MMDNDKAIISDFTTAEYVALSPYWRDRVNSVRDDSLFEDRPNRDKVKVDWPTMTQEETDLARDRSGQRFID